MSDIFEILGVNAELRIQGKVYKFCDPKFKDKIAVMKELETLRLKKGELDPNEAALADWDVSKKYVQLYIPDLSDLAIEEMGQHSFQALFEAVTEMASQKFGAHVKKVDDSKKKEMATP